MDASNSGVTSALQAWINTFDIAQKVETWQDLRDGLILWQVLQEMDPVYFTGSLPASGDGKWRDNWVQRKENLGHIDIKATSYIRDNDVSKDAGHFRSRHSDLASVAREGTQQPTNELVMSVLLAGLYTQNAHAVQNFSQLPEHLLRILGDAVYKAKEDDERQAIEETVYATESQLELATEGEGHDTANDTDASDAPDEMHPKDQQDAADKAASLHRDPELEREEETLKAYQQIKELQAANRLLQQEKQELGGEKRNLEAQNQALKEESERRQQHGVNSTQDTTNALSKDNEDYIADIELQLQSNEEEIRKKEQRIEQLEAIAAKAQQTQDEIRILRAEASEFAKKARMADNYAKKVETLQEESKAIERIRNENEELREQVQDMEHYREKDANWQRIVAENAKTMANIEQNNWDNREIIGRLQKDNANISRAYEREREKANSLEEQNAALSEQIAEGQGAPSARETFENLDDELNEDEKPAQRKPARRSTLSSPESMQLRQDNAALKEQVKLLQESIRQSHSSQDEQQTSPAEQSEKDVRNWADIQEITKIKDEQAAKIVSLEQQLQAVKALPATPAGEQLVAEDQRELANLKRENKLLTSAWYDLTSRLQSNTVVLQRRSEAPKSWLGRQRQAANQGGQIRR